MSAIMSLKLFDKVGVYLNLKIDDPTFQKLVYFAGYITAYNFMFKFDYHTFGGTVTWTGKTPNPIPDEVNNFRNQWNNVSLLYRIDHINLADILSSGNNLKLFLRIPLLTLNNALSNIGLLGPGRMTAIGLGFAQFDMPLEYRVQPRSRVSNSGFGLIKGEVWGISIICDTFSWRINPIGSGISGSFISIPFFEYLWINVDWFHGFRPFGSIGKGETDARAIAWMSDANNGVSVNGDLNKSMQYGIFKANFGLQYIWKFGQKGRIGLAVGVEILEETIEASNDDINIYFWSRHIGPAMRVSVRW
jgi:hypothetical protein